MSTEAGLGAEELHEPPRAAVWLPASLFAVIALLMGGDIVIDASEGAAKSHLVVESVVLLLAALGAGSLLARVIKVSRMARLLRTREVKARADAVKWQEEARALLDGLSAAIDKQFSQWQLSAAEREVGLLLLKGLPLREIASVRGTSERTVRQQALALYRKAQVEGRAELSAFFLEDLLLPRS